MKIYLTRHSKTEWNKEGKLQGHMDSPLLDEGIENAIALKQHINDCHFDYIYSSPILRAYSTAKLIFDEQRIIKDKRLSEMNFGVFEGRKTSDIALNKEDAMIYHQLWDQPECFKGIPGGESYEDVIDRVQSFLDDLKLLDQDSSVFIVTHGMLFIVMIATMLKLERKDFIQINQKVVEGCSLTLIEYKNDVYDIKKYNDYHFLPHTKTPSFIK